MRWETAAASPGWARSRRGRPSHPVASPEEDRGAEPVRLPEPVAPVVEEVGAVAAQEEQRQGVCEGRIVPFEELARGGVREPGQGFEGCRGAF